MPYHISELQVFARYAAAQLRNGTESLAHGPANCSVLLSTRDRTRHVILYRHVLYCATPVRCSLANAIAVVSILASIEER